MTDAAVTGPEIVAPSNVVEFTPKREYVWEHRCAANGQKFWLHRDGSVQCCECKEYVDTLCWGKRGESA